VAAVDGARRLPARSRGTKPDPLASIVRAAASGDGRAWAALVERFSRRVYAVARAHRLGAHDVEDVAQATWLRLLRRIHTVRDPEALGAWLETTARRECLRLINAGPRELPIDRTPMAEAANHTPLDEALIAADRSASLAAARARLPRHQQRLLAALLAEHEPSYAEIARSLDMPIGSIGPTRARLLERLRVDQNLVGAIRGDRLSPQS
jgi:RNA polymerase sigma factor (sigma-70 family)